MSGTLSADQALPLISQYESGNRNVLSDLGSSASGYFQIVNGTWRQYAPLAGIDTTLYPTAMSDPSYADQAAVASAIYNAQGFAPWASNGPLMQAVGGATAGAQGAGAASGASAGTTPNACQGALGGFSPACWLATATSYIEAGAARLGIGLLGVILLIGAVWLFANRTQIVQETAGG